MQQVAPYVAPVASWGDYEQASGGGSCADDPNTCDTRFTIIKSSGGLFYNHPNTCEFIIILFFIVVEQSIFSGSPMMRSCSIPGACIGTYLSCRKWPMQCSIPSHPIQFTCSSTVLHPSDIAFVTLSNLTQLPGPNGDLGVTVTLIIVVMATLLCTSIPGNDRILRGEIILS